MRLLLTIGYQKLLFANGAPVAELIMAVDGAQIVRQEGGYGSPKRFIPDGDSTVEVELVPDSSASLPESDSSVFDSFHRVATERDEAKTKVRELESQVKELRAAIDTAASVAKQPEAPAPEF